MKPIDANNIMHWSGMKSVPIIFDGPNLVGGFNALEGYFKGKGV